MTDISNDNPNADKLKHDYQKMVSNGTKICEKIKDNSKKNGIMREASHKFHNADFIEKMDQNPYLLGFKNGVVDFKEKCFRVGYPEDYITKSTKMDYIPKEKIKNYDAKRKEIEEYMETLFPIPELRNYMWDHLGINTYWY